MSKKWDADYITRFFELLEKYPSLYEINSPEFKDRRLRDEALSNLARDMSLDMDIEGFGLEEARAKLKVLKSSYIMEMRKLTKRNNSGSGYTYRPNVKWFPTADRFLRKTVTHLFNKSQPQNRVVKKYNYKYVKEDPLSTEITVKFEENGDEDDEQEENEDEWNMNKSTSSAPVITNKQFNNTNIDQQENEFEVFGRTVGCMLKKLPENVALQSMSHIQTYLCDQRLKLINANQRAQHFVSVNESLPSSHPPSSQHFISVNESLTSRHPSSNTMTWQ